MFMLGSCHRGDRLSFPYSHSALSKASKIIIIKKKKLPRQKVFLEISLTMNTDMYFFLFFAYIQSLLIEDQNQTE